MKASLKLREDKNHHQNPLVRAKLPVHILGLPFISSFTAGDPIDLSFNLYTNFLSGPSLKLSYTPTAATTAATPISLSLKSGVGIFGSPNNSPLIISAHFNLFATPHPTFSLQIKPQFGDFFLSKTAVSTVPPNPKQNGCAFPYNTDAPEMQRPIVRMLNMYEAEDGLFSGVAVKAKTALPVAKFAAVKLRWGVNFPADSVEKLRLPYLTVDKISIERVEEEVKMVEGEKKVSEMEALKGMCFWMRKQVEGLQVENNAIKERLEEMKMRARSHPSKESSNNVGRNVMVSGNSSEFETWRNKKNAGEESGRREVKKLSGSKNTASDVGEELKRAIEAASANGHGV